MAEATPAIDATAAGAPAAPASPPPAPAAPPQRAIVRKAERVPLPRRLVLMALAFGFLSLVLGALPRPWKPLDKGVIVPDGLLSRLGESFGDTAAAIKPADGLEPLAGEASTQDKTRYRRELWMHRWWGVEREIVLWWSERLTALCLFGAAGLTFARMRRESRAMRRRGARLDPEILRRESIETRDEIPVATALPEKPRLPEVVEPKAPVVVTAPSFEVGPPAVNAAPATAAAPPTATTTTSAPPPASPTPAPEAVPAVASPTSTAEVPGVDPALAKLGFQPLPASKAADLDDEDDDGNAKTPNLAARAATARAPEATVPSAQRPADPVPATVAERAFPIGFPQSGTRPVVRPGSAPPADPETSEPNPAWWPGPGGSSDDTDD